MRRLWRISNYFDLAGVGGLRAPGRWHHRGFAVVYCSETPATALLEALAHLEIDSLDDLPVNYQLLEIKLPKGFRAPRIGPLPTDWKEQIAHTRDLGTHWLVGGRHVALRVPSALVPHSDNILLNPRLLPGSGVGIVKGARYPFDERLFKVIKPTRG